MSKDNGGPASDRELLEMAAKAAGITSVGYGRNGIATGRNGPCLVGYWNPLTDDGDAMRLAVNLGLVVDAYAMRAISATRLAYGHNDWVCGLDEGDDDMDEYEATRRAIVRAAAAIGSAM